MWLPPHGCPYPVYTDTGDYREVRVSHAAASMMAWTSAGVRPSGGYPCLLFAGPNVAERQFAPICNRRRVPPFGWSRFASAVVVTGSLWEWSRLFSSALLVYYVPSLLVLRKVPRSGGGHHAPAPLPDSHVSGAGNERAVRNSLRNLSDQIDVRNAKSLTLTLDKPIGLVFRVAD